jgi:hypothetical protein
MPVSEVEQAGADDWYRWGKQALQFRFERLASYGAMDEKKAAEEMDSYLFGGPTAEEKMRKMTLRGKLEGRKGVKIKGRQ